MPFDSNWCGRWIRKKKRFVYFWLLFLLLRCWLWTKYRKKYGDYVFLCGGWFDYFWPIGREENSYDCVRGVESSQYNNFSTNTMPTRRKIVLVAVGQCSQINIAASRDDPKKLVYNRIKKIMYRWKTPDSIKTWYKIIYKFMTLLINIYCSRLCLNYKSKLFEKMIYHSI